MAADHTVLGESYGFWCQNLILFLAALLAFIAIISARRIERKKSAMEAIFEGKKDAELQKGLRLIALIHDGEKKIAHFAKKNELDSDESKSIRYVLNHFESLSVGIFRGTYDEKTLKSSQYSTITRLYDRTKPYIEAIRAEQDGSPTFYQEVECLACRWKAKGLKQKPIRAMQVHTLKNFFGL